MKKALLAVMIIAMLSGIAMASNNVRNAYDSALREVDPATASLVRNIDLAEFADHFGLELSADDELLIRTAMLAYTNGAMKEHPYSPGFSRAMTSVGDAEPEGNTYIGNKKTKKFHEPYCSSVSDIKDSNKVTLGSRDEAVRKGYQPCKRCNP